jgi:acyl-CoA dehydrogenase
MIPLPTDRSLDIRSRVAAFMDEHIYPNEARYEAELHEDPQQPFRQPPVMEELKKKPLRAGWACGICSSPTRNAGPGSPT